MKKPKVEKEYKPTSSRYVRVSICVPESSSEIDELRRTAQKNLEDSVKGFKDKAEANDSLNKELIELGVSGFCDLPDPE